jgi:hypothetical protein
MLIGIVAWLSLAVLGLRWVLSPYWWASRPVVGGAGPTLKMAQAEFPIHVASFSRKDTPPPPPADDAEPEPIDAATMSWIWRETLGRFVIGFALWMASGWFVHWFTGRIVRGPQRKLATAQ